MVGHWIPANFPEVPMSAIVLQWKGVNGLACFVIETSFTLHDTENDEIMLFNKFKTSE